MVAGGLDSTNNRRQKENQTYIDMAESIPLPEKDTKDLDRASVLRVTIGYVKLRESVNMSKERTKHRMEVVAKSELCLCIHIHMHAYACTHVCTYVRRYVCTYYVCRMWSHNRGSLSTVMGIYQHVGGV